MLVVAAVLPLAGWSVFTMVRDARNAVELAKSSLQLSASLAVTGLDGVAESTRNLLTAMAHAEEVRQGSARCEDYMRRLRERFPQYGNFGVASPDGVIRCSSEPGTQGIRIGDRPYFIAAVQTRDFSVGDFMKGRATGGNSVGFGLPLYDEKDQLHGVLYAALDLSGFSRVVGDAKLPPGGRMIVVDRNSMVLAAQTDSGARLGERAASEGLRTVIERGVAGVAEAVDAQGRARVFAFAPATASGTRGSLWVAIGMDRDQIVASSLRVFYVQLAVLALMTLVGGALAWWFAGRMLLRPMQQILDMADRVADGDLDQRVVLKRGAAADELVRVGETLNQMAEALQRRQQELQAELLRSQQAQTTQSLIFNSMHEGLWAISTDGRMVLFNDAAARIFPVSADMEAASEWPDSYGVHMPDSEVPLSADDMPLQRALRGETGQSDIAVRNTQMPRGCVLRCSYRPLTSAGAVVGALVVFSDITELRKAELHEAQTYAKLRETQRQLVDALRIGRIGNWERDLKTSRLWWSDEVYEIAGLPRGSLDTSLAAAVNRVHPEDRAMYTLQREESIQRRTTLDVEFRLLMDDGSVRWLHQRGEVRRDAAGEPVSHAGVIQDITTRKKSEAELFLLRNAVDRLNDIVMIARTDEASPEEMRTVFVNPAIERLTGHSMESVMGKSLPLLYGPETDPAVVQRMRQAVALRQQTREQLLSYTRSGGQLWLEFDLVPFETAPGKADHWILVGRDVTGRKLAEAALAESEQRYQALFQKAPLPMWVFDESGTRFLDVNDAAIRQYGYTREEFLARGLADVRPERERLRLEQRLAQGYQGVTEGWTHRRKDNSEFPVDVTSRPVVYAGTRARFAVIHDTSARVQAEQNLQEYMFTLQRATDASQMVVAHQTLQGTLQEVVEQSRAVIRAHQAIVTLVSNGDWANAVSAVSMSDKYARYRDFTIDPDASGIYALVCESNRPMRFTQEQLEQHPRWKGFSAHATGHPPMRGWLAVPLTNRRGDNIGLLQLTDKYEGLFTLQDEYVAVEMAQLASIAMENVSLLEEVRALNTGLERKVDARTLELAREQARYQALADQAPQIIWSYEHGRGVTYFNRNWYELVGGTADYWLGNRWVDAIHPEDRDTSLANWVLARQSRTVYKGERRLRDKFGRYHIMSYRGAPVFDETGNVLSWVGIDTDITEFKAVEAELRESNRELEAFSYSVSHDLRSPLNTIHGFSRLLARELGTDMPERVQHYVNRIQAATGYMGQLIEDLLSLAQVSRANLRDEPVDLSEVARGIVERLRQTEPQRDVAVDIEDGLIAQGDIRLLRVVMENLLGNAWKFTSSTPQAQITVGALNGQSVFFVRDNGAGFDMTYVDKLFGVFQRLHAVAEFPGTGIGLATVHRIVTRHRGRVWAHGQPSQGATFFFTLNEAPVPAAPEDAGTVLQAPEKAAS
jgi:PAS domain S-box-containing protein